MTLTMKNSKHHLMSGDMNKKDKQNDKYCQTGVSFIIPGNMLPSINETTLKLTEMDRKVRRNE